MPSSLPLVSIFVAIRHFLHCFFLHFRVAVILRRFRTERERKGERVVGYEMLFGWAAQSVPSKFRVLFRFSDRLESGRSEESMKPSLPGIMGGRP